MATITETAMPIDIGIDEQTRRDIAASLSRLLADTYTLYLKTHNFHWNVTGPMFQTLHLMFETQYNELWNAVDPVAERIRALGYPAPGSYSEFAKLSSIPESKGIPEAMLQSPLHCQLERMRANMPFCAKRWFSPKGRS